MCAIRLFSADNAHTPGLAYAAEGGRDLPYFLAPAAGTGLESATPTVDVATCSAT